jgi:antitoxin component of MazEF toxin-antitoxin module
MLIEVERKLFATGDSLAITLPKAWTKYFRLKAGDTLKVVANNEVIIRIMSPEKNIDFHTDLTKTK